MARSSFTVPHVPAAAQEPAAVRYRSPLRYPGGKQKAIEEIAGMFPRSAREYREPMVGGGSVLFHVRSIGFAKSYWINDRFEELISFWRAVQDPVKCQRLADDLEKLRSSFESVEEIKRYFFKKSGHHFLITYDDCKEIRQLYSWAKSTKWRLQYGMNNCNAENLSKTGSELFICNY